MKWVIFSDCSRECFNCLLAEYQLHMEDFCLQWYNYPIFIGYYTDTTHLCDQTFITTEKDENKGSVTQLCLLWAHKYSKMGQTSSKKQSQTAMKMNNNKKKTSVFSLDSSEVEAGNNKPIESLFFFFLMEGKRNSSSNYFKKHTAFKYKWKVSLQ